MNSGKFSIKRKVVAVTMLTSIVVVGITVTAFMTYDVITFRDSMVRSLKTLAQITADNSTAALAFHIEKDATERLSALRLEPQIVGAALYDSDGKLFAVYPTNAPAGLLPES